MGSGQVNLRSGRRITILLQSPETLQGPVNSLRISLGKSWDQDESLLELELTKLLIDADVFIHFALKKSISCT